MKILKSIAASMVVIVLLFTLTAADSYNNTIQVSEGDYDVTITGTIAFTAGATDSHYSKAIFIGDCNYYNYFMVAWTNATASDDVNLNIEYSMDRTTWKAATINSGALFDDLNGGTVQTDTVNVYEGAGDPLFQTARWMRFYCDGQSGNTTPVTVTVGIHFTKTQKSKKLGAARIKDRIT